LTGIATGTIASCLDVLSSWLSDLRLGVCRDMWWMSRNLCCAGLDRKFSFVSTTLFRLSLTIFARPTAGETCRAWKTWGEIVGEEQHVFTRAVTQYGLYMLLAVSRFSLPRPLNYTETSLHRFYSLSPLRCSFKCSRRTHFTRESQRSKRFSEDSLWMVSFHPQLSSSSLSAYLLPSLPVSVSAKKDLWFM
jgi:hypothetical protein